METYDALVIGGGPAGSTCAWKLRQHGMNIAVLDAATFPRLKLCAGWITPEVVDDLELDLAAYPHRLLTFRRLHMRLWGLNFPLKTTQYSIRRVEFDDWLLKRAGAPVIQHAVRNIRFDQGQYIIDDAYRCKYLIGAGGTSCPVYRTLFKALNPRAKDRQIATLEQEFPFDYRDPDCRLWFLEHGLPGYSWYVPKEGGYLNIGIGGFAHKISQGDRDIKQFWALFVDKLRQQSLLDDRPLAPKGYSYFLREKVRVGQSGNAYIVGDAAGLATRDFGEGIGPAIESGLLAARAILTGQPYTLDRVSQYSLVNMVLKHGLHLPLRRASPFPPLPQAVQPVV